MGPLSKVWHALESATTALDDETDLTIEDLLNLVQQCFLLLVGQRSRPKQRDALMRRKLLPVFMSVLWPRTSPIRFHKTPKDPRSPFKDRDTHSNLFGLVDYW